MKRFPRAILLAVGLALLGQIVSAVEKKPEWKGKIVKEGEVTVVQNPKEPINKDPALSMKVDWSVGGGAADANSSFAEARTLAVDEADNVFVLDSQECLVKAFDRNGKYVVTFGRKGQGPGELQYPRNICFNTTTKELVIDGPSSNLSFFSTAGKFLRSLPLKSSMGLRMRIDSHGNYFYEDFILDPANSIYFTNKCGPDLKFIARVAQSPAAKPGMTFDPFRAVNYWQIDKDDNLVYGYPADYEIRFHSPANKIIKKLRREYVPVEVTDAEKKEASKDAPPQLKMEPSKFHSAFRRFVLSDQGHILVKSWEKAPGGASYYFDLFDAQGRYVSKIPLKGEPIVWKNGKLYTIEEDDEGYKVVKKYSVTWTKD